MIKAENNEIELSGTGQEIIIDLANIVCGIYRTNDIPISVIEAAIKCGEEYGMKMRKDVPNKSTFDMMFCDLFGGEHG